MGERHVVFLHHGQRLSELTAQFAGGAVQRIQHIFFSIRLSLLASERIAGNSASFQSDDVLASDAVNAPVQHGLDAIALADFAAALSGPAIPRPPPHELPD